MLVAAGCGLPPTFNVDLHEIKSRDVKLGSNALQLDKAGCSIAQANWHGPDSC
jgi:hypothetical protein